MPTYLSCPFCKHGLSSKNAFILNGNSTVKCPKCLKPLIIEYNVKCYVCSRPALQIVGNEIFQGGAVYGEKVYNYIYLCALHGNEKLFNCPECGKVIKSKFITLSNGELKGKCENCQSENTLCKNVVCDEAKEGTKEKCSNIAVGINWQNTLYRTYPLPHFYCIEHKHIQKKYGCLSSTMLILVLALLIFVM